MYAVNVIILFSNTLNYENLNKYAVIKLYFPIFFEFKPGKKLKEDYVFNID